MVVSNIPLFNYDLDAAYSFLEEEAKKDTRDHGCMIILPHLISRVITLIKQVFHLFSLRSDRALYTTETCTEMIYEYIDKFNNCLEKRVQKVGFFDESTKKLGAREVEFYQMTKAANDLFSKLNLITKIAKKLNTIAETKGESPIFEWEPVLIRFETSPIQPGFKVVANQFNIIKARSFS